MQNRGHASWWSCDGEWFIINIITSLIFVMVVMPSGHCLQKYLWYLLWSTDNHQLEGSDMLAKDSEVDQRSQRKRNLGHRDGIRCVHIYFCAHSLADILTSYYVSVAIDLLNMGR